MQVTEIFNFSQDDLMTEDIFILDCYSEIFVWVGQQVDPKSRMQALTIGEVLLVLLCLETITLTYWVVFWTQLTILFFFFLPLNDVFFFLRPLVLVSLWHSLIVIPLLDFDLTNVNVLYIMIKHLLVFLKSYVDLVTISIEQKFLERDILLENLSHETPIYIVMEGSEPPFFTRFFAWESAKSAVSFYCNCIITDYRSF